MINWNVKLENNAKKKLGNKENSPYMD